ncbi:alpha/beta-hydrolase [Cryphonectria parasitica EP155]|uniref:Alpha/beta-hydrolase n=1 Tax=Cryphonectria parasitica (strain ATCC 38755 / EP155) TaxID=660469 RepID=A0A9P4XTN5_CRYP1|nr:alpha/beta-hydrolase [Cryphonectria parasitica EP155]KAF3761124.1 alpha/beta-hydrolase [Cryphonectria parasitica EP155]
MADADVATKAPESDAQEDVQQPTDSSAAEEGPAQPKMGEHCVTDRPTPSGEGPTGEIRKLNDIDVYVSKPSEYPHVPARLLLLLTGGTGLKSANNQIQADRFASEGYLVVMPDLFQGDVAPNSTTVDAEQAAEGTSSFLDTFKIKAAETAKSFLIDMWLARHTEEKVLPILHKVIDGAKDEFADAVSNGGGIYAVGYCFGARYILLLAAERKPVVSGGFLGGAPQPADEEAGASANNGPFIKAGALAHATLVAREDFDGLKVPVSLVCVENDPMFPDDVRTYGENYLAKTSVEHEVQVYPGVPHGFAVVGDYEDGTIKEAQRTAFEQMLKWLKDH